jgi:hypothetical protein
MSDERALVQAVLDSYASSTVKTRTLYSVANAIPAARNVNQPARLARALGFAGTDAMGNWNNQPGRTFAHVQAVLRAALVSPDEARRVRAEMENGA